MHKAVEAVIDENGFVRLKESVRLHGFHRAIVTILDEDEDDITLLSEKSLAKDWNCPEEDEAWAHLQQDQ